jgi:cohesin complex subunit SA-1/2
MKGCLVRAFSSCQDGFTNDFTAEVFSDDGSLKDVAAQWLTSYQQNGPEAMTEFVNFLLKSAGCHTQVTVDHVEDIDNAADRVAEIQAEFQAVSISSIL